MAAPEGPVDLSDLVDSGEAGPEWDAWLAAHPAAAEEVALARRVHALLAQLGAEPLPLPPDFEARLLARCRQDATLLDLLDLALAKGGRTVLELLGALFGLLPAPQPPTA